MFTRVIILGFCSQLSEVFADYPQEMRKSITEVLLHDR